MVLAAVVVLAVPWAAAAVAAVQLAEASVVALGVDSVPGAVLVLVPARESKKDLSRLDSCAWHFVVR